MWLAHDMKDLRGTRGLEAGCGLMLNRRYFRTESYVGVDSDPDRIASATSRLAEDASRITGVVSQIEDLDEKWRSDVVLCVQTIGTNARFDHARAHATVEKLIALTKPRGTLILNVGKKSPHHEIELALQKAFDKVIVRRYGRMSRAVPIPLSIVLAYVMRFVPALREDSKIYFLCKQKRPSA